MASFDHFNSVRNGTSEYPFFSNSPYSFPFCVLILWCTYILPAYDTRFVHYVAHRSNVGPSATEMLIFIDVLWNFTGSRAKVSFIIGVESAPNYVIGLIPN